MIDMRSERWDVGFPVVRSEQVYIWGMDCVQTAELLLKVQRHGVAMTI
jgi:hypothetical protein